MQTIILNNTQFHLLSLVASAQGLTVEEYVSTTLNRLFRSLAELQGISPAPGVEPEQVHAPGAPPQPPHKLTRAERRAERRAAAAAAAAPTAEQAAELARQLAEHGAPEQGRDPLATRTPGYDPEFTPDPENFGQLN